MRYLSTTCVVLLMAACGGVKSQDPDADVPGGPQAACDLDQPFGTPTLMANINSDVQDSDGYMSADGLEFYFASERPGGLGGLDIWVATRASTSDDFGLPALVPSVNSADNDAGPVISKDGLTLYPARYMTGGDWKIQVATRTSTEAAFDIPAPLLNVNDPGGADIASHINATGTTLYLSSTRTGDWEMMRATRASASGPFSAATPIGELNVAGVEDYGPVLTEDELTVYFESTRAGSLGCYDVYVAKRSSLTDGFGPPVRVEELSTDSCEWPTWVSADGCQLVLVSNRPGGMGSHDLWLASRP